MADRPLRLLLLAIVIELFAVILAISPATNPLAFFPFALILVLGRLASLPLGVIGLVVAFVGFSARE